MRPREMPRARRRVWVLLADGEGVLVESEDGEADADAGALMAVIVGAEELAGADELAEEEMNELAEVADGEAEAESRS